MCQFEFNQRAPRSELPRVTDGRGGRPIFARWAFVPAPPTPPDCTIPDRHCTPAAMFLRYPLRWDHPHVAPASGAGGPCATASLRRRHCRRHWGSGRRDAGAAVCQSTPQSKARPCGATAQALRAPVCTAYVHEPLLLHIHPRAPPATSRRPPGLALLPQDASSLDVSGAVVTPAFRATPWEVGAPLTGLLGFSPTLASGISHCPALCTAA